VYKNKEDTQNCTHFRGSATNLLRHAGKLLSTWLQETEILFL